MLKVYANYGAMFARQVLTIKSMNNGLCIAANEAGEESRFKVSEVRDQRPSKGSPIGLYWNERDAY